MRKRKLKPIHAAAAPALEPILIATAFEVQAADGAEAKGPRKFSATVYNGGELPVNHYSLPVVIDLQGLSFAKSITANLHHDQKQIVGHVTEKDNNGRRVVLGGLVSGTGDAAREFVGNHDNGFPWQASVEVPPSKLVELKAGKQAVINGREFTGPLYIARKSRLRGVAFLGRGADEDTSVTIAAEAATSGKGQSMTFEQWIEAMELDLAALTDAQKKKLRVKYDAEIKASAKDEGEEGLESGSGNAAPRVAKPEFDLDEIKAAHADFLANVELKLEERVDETPKPKFTEIKAAALKTAKELKAKALREKWAAPKFEVQAAQALADLQVKLITAAAPQGPAIHSSQRDATPAVIEAALARTAGLPTIEKFFDEKTLEAADKHFRGFGLQQALIMGAAANGRVCRPGERLNDGNHREILEYATDRRAIMAAGASSIDVASILESLSNKELLAGFRVGDQSWREVAKVKPVNDFKAVKSYRLTDNLEYEEVGPDGQVKHGKLGNESYTRQAKSYAKMLVLTRVDQINDDLGAFDDLRVRLGKGSTLKLNKLFWATFLNNASFFTTARGNLVTGAANALGSAGLKAAVEAFLKLKTGEGEFAEGTPDRLLVPPELGVTADELYQSTNVNTGGSATTTKVPNKNVFAGKYRPVACRYLSDARLTGYSSAGYYLLGNPDELPAAVVSFLFGNESPTITSSETDIGTLGIAFRGVHDFGVDLAEYLCGVKVTGVDP